MAGLISNGSFVLGDPNTRDLYLGKGLKDGFEGDKYYIAADETVLWEGDGTPVSTCTLNEPFTNFERVKIYVGDAGGYGFVCNEFEVPRAVNTFQVSWGSGAANLYKRSAYITVSNNNVFTVSKTLDIKYTYSTSPTITYTVDTYKSCIFKVIGVNRKRG